MVSRVYFQVGQTSVCDGLLFLDRINIVIENCFLFVQSDLNHICLELYCKLRDYLIYPYLKEINL
jgi:hypothetical protein